MKGPRCHGQKQEQISECVITAQRQSRDRHWHAGDEWRNTAKKLQKIGFKLFCSTSVYQAPPLHWCLDPALPLSSTLRNSWDFAFFTMLTLIELFTFSFCSTDSTNSIFFINIVSSYLGFKKLHVAVLHHGIKLKFLKTLL